MNHERLERIEDIKKIMEDLVDLESTFQALLIDLEDKLNELRGEEYDQ